MSIKAQKTLIYLIYIAFNMYLIILHSDFPLEWLTPLIVAILGASAIIMGNHAQRLYLERIGSLLLGLITLGAVALSLLLIYFSLYNQSEGGDSLKTQIYILTISTGYLFLLSLNTIRE